MTGKPQTKSASVRLTLYEWAELDYAAREHGRTRNDEIRWRLAQHRVPMPEPVSQGQTSIFDEAPEEGGEGTARP